MQKILLAIVGLAGAGKTVATEYLMKTQNWPKVYLGQGVIDEVHARGLDLNEQNERQVREDLRKQHGMAAMAIVNLPKIRELFQTSSVIIESLYSWQEYTKLKEEFGDSFKVLAVYASPETRIARMAIRPFRPLNREQLISRDYSQIENLQQAGPIARSEYTIVNEGSLDELYKNLDSALTQLLSKP